MNQYIHILLFISISFSNCNAQQNKLQKLCADIRSTSQLNLSNKGQDPKIKLIRELKNFDGNEVCDSLKAIFLSIDTTKGMYWNYKYEPLYILSEKNTPKSLLVLSEIIRDYQLSYPANMFFIWDLVRITENVSVMFPNLSKSLGRQKWTDGDILRIIINASRKGHISKEHLTSSKEYLINFYDYLKIEKDSLPGSKKYAKYYETHLTNLLICLRMFEPDEKINQIYKDVLVQNSSFKKFCSTHSAEYNNESKQKITALFQASAGLLQNNQNVEEKYLELIAAEPLYHNDFYLELSKLNKQSLFPQKFVSQQFFAMSDLAFKKEHTIDDGLPNCLIFLDKQEVAKGKNKGIYYFFQSKYGDDEKEIFIEVSGPQPLSSADFILDGNKTNKLYIGRCQKDKVSKKIKETLATLSE